MEEHNEAAASAAEEAKAAEVSAQEQADRLAAFDGDDDGAMRFDDLRTVDGSDEGGSAPDPEHDIRRYGRENVVMFDVPHVRVMRGETDEVIHRTRTAEAENAILDVIRDAGEKCQPDWFTEWWLAEQRQLVVVAVFERPEWASAFKRAISKLKIVTPRGGKGLRERMLAKYNHAWTVSHRKNMGRFAQVVEKLKGKYEGCAVLVEHEYDPEVEDSARKDFDELAKRIAASFPTEDGKVGFAWTVVNDLSRHVTRVAFAAPEAERAKALYDWLRVEDGGDRVELAEDALARNSGDAAYDDTTLTIVATLYAKLEQDLRIAEAKAKAAERAKAKAGEGAEVRPAMGEPVGGRPGAAGI